MSSIRPLPNGSILLTDPVEQRIELRAFESDVVAPVARQGFGPQEWSRAVALFPSSKYGSVQFDPIARRLHFYTGATLVRIAPPDSSSTPSLLILGASDDAVLYFLVPPGREGGPASLGPDSLAVVRTRVGSVATDTLAMLRDAPGQVVRRTDDAGNTTPIAIRRPAFAIGEQSIAFQDGWIAVARLDPYRIDWRTPDGQWLHGPEAPVPARPLTETVRDAYLRQSAALIERLRHAPDDVRAALMSRFEDFPALVPPVGPDALRAGYDEHLYAERVFLPLDSTRVYDVFDRLGERVRILVLPARERLLAATGTHVFTVRSDSLDLQRVVRYARVK